MIKNKPAMHVRKNDVLVFRSWAGRERTSKVSNVSEYAEDSRFVRIEFPEVFDAQGLELEPSSSLVFDKNEQVLFVG